MYKVAFPGATEDDEKREMDWVCLVCSTRFYLIFIRLNLRMTRVIPTGDAVVKLSGLQASGESYTSTWDKFQHRAGSVGISRST